MTTFSIIFGGEYKVMKSAAIYMYIMEVNESEICDEQSQEQVKFIHHPSLEEVEELTEVAVCCPFFRSVLTCSF